MNKLIKVVSAFVICGTALAGIQTRVCDDRDTRTCTGRDVYDFVMKVDTPRIYDNTQSLGYRKYQKQTIKGYLIISYLDDGTTTVSIESLANKTQTSITYSCTVGGDGYPTRVYLVGNNKTDVFKTASVAFSLDAEPSYNKGADDEDNSLIITLSGHGTCAKDKKANRQYIKNLKGTLAGTLGCGCYAYGHKSPTRKANYCGHTDQVVDVAAVSGTWSAKFNKKLSASCD